MFCRDLQRESPSANVVPAAPSRELGYVQRAMSDRELNRRHTPVPPLPSCLLDRRPAIVIRASRRKDELRSPSRLHVVVRPPALDRWRALEVVPGRRRRSPSFRPTRRLDRLQGNVVVVVSSAVVGARARIIDLVWSVGSFGPLSRRLVGAVGLCFAVGPVEGRALHPVGRTCFSSWPKLGLPLLAHRSWDPWGPSICRPDRSRP